MNRERLRDEFLELVRISSVSKREGNVASATVTMGRTRTGPWASWATPIM